MYKVLLVDDENIILEGLSRMIDWGGFGCEICAKAHSVEEGIEFIKTLHPDIIFTDIMMKHMTGLEMLDQVYEYIKNAYVVIITGYRDFEYAQKAISLGVSDFVLKPTKLSQLNEIVEKAVNKLNHTKTLEKEVNELKQELQNTKQELTENAVSNLIISDIDSFDTTGTYSVLSKLKFSRFFIWTTSIPYSEISKNSNVEECVKRILFTIFPENIKNFRLNSTIDGDLAGLAILTEDSDKSEIKLYEIMKKVCSLLKEVYSSEVYMGISTFGSDIHEIRNKYLESHQALEHRYYMQNDNIFFYSDLPDILPQFGDGDSEYCISLIDSILTGNIETLNSCWEKVNAHLESIGKLREVKNFVINTILKIYDAYKAISKNTSFPNNSESISKMVNRCATRGECIDFLHEICCTMSQNVYNYNNGQIKSKISKAIDFIKERYNEQITRNDIAEYINVSPNYVSALFKKELNKTLVEFINQTRIENAKRMLRETDDKIYKIADDVGFTDVYYFSKTFKTVTGYTPSEWRLGK
ncbi:MAG: response regulator [Firmicutes bacterium]|nr:response regulator [Bacillota bacterium]